MHSPSSKLSHLGEKSCQSWEDGSRKVLTDSCSPMKNKVTSLEGGVVCSRGTRGKADNIVPKSFAAWRALIQSHLSKHRLPVGRELWWNRSIRECHGPPQCLSSFRSKQCYLHLALFLKPRKLREMVKSFMWLWESRFLWEFNATVGWHLLCNIIF